MEVKITFVDSTVKQALVDKGCLVHSVFETTLNLLVEDTLVSVMSIPVKSKHHILIDKPLNFKKAGIRPHVNVKVETSGFMLANHVFMFKQDAHQVMRTYQTTYDSSALSKQRLKQVKQAVLTANKVTFYTHDEQDTILRYQFAKMGKFLSHPTEANMLGILGLGMGLTPLGDDVLVGYILAKKSINETIEWVETLKNQLHKTNKISAQSILDTLHGDYSETFIDLLNFVFLDEDNDALNKILSYGATSGAGILTGFYEALEEKECEDESL